MIKVKFLEFSAHLYRWCLCLTIACEVLHFFIGAHNHPVLYLKDQRFAFIIGYNNLRPHYPRGSVLRDGSPASTEVPFCSNLSKNFVSRTFTRTVPIGVQIPTKRLVGIGVQRLRSDYNVVASEILTS